MKRRKKGGGGGANWMDTYGDMVTLLLCFFVLLYAMSTISEENWKAVVMSFNPDAAKDVSISEGNDGPVADPNADVGLDEGMTQEKVDQDMEALFEELKEYVNQEGVQNNIAVAKSDGRVFVTFNDAVFFDGDDWTLREESLPILEKMGSILSKVADSIDEVRILGHTAQAYADRPNNIQTDRLLSAQRAANALAYIQTHTTVDPARMVSEGYGQWQPVASNDTPEERAKNRRIEMIVSGRDIEAELSGNIKNYMTR